MRGKEFEVVQARKKRDGYGRLLAYVFVNDSLINARLLEEGWPIFLPLVRLSTMENGSRFSAELKPSAKACGKRESSVRSRLRRCMQTQKAMTEKPEWGVCACV